MTSKEKKIMIEGMSSICKNCKYIEVNDDIKRFVCNKYDMVVMGVTLNCNGFKYAVDKMKTIKLGSKKELECPTIVKVGDDYYLVSIKHDPEAYETKTGHTMHFPQRHTAINLTDGKWFDWGEDISCLNLEMETFKEGTKFEIEI